MLLIIVLIGLMSMDRGDGLSIDHELPCNFLDSINITGGAVQPDNSIIFGDTRFTENQYSRIDYVIDNGTNQVPVEPYLRGCLCNIKPCIRLCCPYGTIHVRLSNGEKGCRQHEAATEFEREIHAENSYVKTLLENHYFGYVDDRPCNKFYLAENYTMTHVMIQPIEFYSRARLCVNFLFLFHRWEMFYLKIKR